MTFEIPKAAIAIDTRCEANLEQKIRCELDAGHDDPSVHRNGPLVWHEPLLVLVGGVPVDTSIESERWQGGRVLLFDDVEPDLA